MSDEMSDLVARLRTWADADSAEAADEITRLAAEVERLKAQVAGLRDTLGIMHQTIIEVAHAQEVGPWWYTKGEPGLFQQVQMWVRKGLAAYASVRVSEPVAGTSASGSEGKPDGH